ncbi:DNA-binding protein [Escherichia coli]|nr:DNA-binding protein [Escherichia coli]
MSFPCAYHRPLARTPKNAKIVEQRERYSRTAINNIKKFWSLTAKGCMFGKNITSPANPRETQPHFFESRFPELLKLLDTVH